MSHIFSLSHLTQHLIFPVMSPSFFLRGDDVLRWANGMFSNNIRKLQERQGNYSAICDDRGRVQGFIYIYRTQAQELLCILEGMSLEAFMKRFQMYMVLDDIECEETDLHLFHAYGDQIEEVFRDNNLPIPEKNHVLSFSEGFIFRSDRLGKKGYDILYSTSNLPQHLDNITPMTSQDLQALRIYNGRAEWPQDGTDKSMIHELGLNEECCAFDKGCYVGQEIINRLDVKGLITKKVHRLELLEGDPNCLSVPTELFVDEKKMGVLSSIAALKQNEEIIYIGIGTIRKAGWSGTQILESQEGLRWKISQQS